jgi:hypothetical protein
MNGKQGQNPQTSVNTRLTAKSDPKPAPTGGIRRRRKRPAGDVENIDYAAFARRIIRAHGRRIAAGDVESLIDLLALTAELDAATQHAVTGLRNFGYSWTEIAHRLGTTRQAAQQRWGGGSHPVT